MVGPYQFTIAEEVNTVTLQWGSILAPRELWDGVTLDGGGDAEFLPLIDCNVAHGPDKSGGVPLDTLLGPRLDGNSGIRPGKSRTQKCAFIFSV